VCDTPPMNYVLFFRPFVLGRTRRSFFSLSDRRGSYHSLACSESQISLRLLFFFFIFFFSRGVKLVPLPSNHCASLSSLFFSFVFALCSPPLPPQFRTPGPRFTRPMLSSDDVILCFHSNTVSLAGASPPPLVLGYRASINWCK